MMSTVLISQTLYSCSHLRILYLRKHASLEPISEIDLPFFSDEPRASDFGIPRRDPCFGVADESNGRVVSCAPGGGFRRERNRLKILICHALQEVTQKLIGVSDMSVFEFLFVLRILASGFEGQADELQSTLCRKTFESRDVLSEKSFHHRVGRCANGFGGFITGRLVVRLR